MPTWAGIQQSAFLAGFGVAEIGGATVFVGLMAFHMVKRLLSAAGL
jgi:hypothetical protein